MNAEVKRKEDNQLEIVVTIPNSRVSVVYGEVIKEEAKNLQLEGFRKGRAPESLVKSKINRKEVYDWVVNRLVSEAYTTVVKEHHLKPIIPPQIELIQFEPGTDKDLVFKAITAERPAVTIGDYKQILENLKGQKILGPDGKPLSSKEKINLNRILKELLKSTKAKIPPILIETEVNRMLASLVDHIAKLGMTVEQYLQAEDKSPEELRGEHRQQAEEVIKTELVLDEIANRENITVTEEEIAKAIQASPNDENRRELEKPINRWYIESIIRRNKVLLFLQGLVE